MNYICPFCKTVLTNSINNYNEYKEWSCNKIVERANNIVSHYNKFFHTDIFGIISITDAVYLKNYYIHNDFGKKLSGIYLYNHQASKWRFIAEVKLLNLDYNSYTEDQLDDKIAKLMNFS